jgi:arabinogalactan endo-1,4-beta-galactosidase
MGKKCIICSKEAEFGIKDSNEYYCKSCAIEHFKDLSYLQKVEKQANIIKDLIKEHGK